MSRRSSIIVVGLLLAAFVGVVLVAIPGSPLHKSPTLGLDLQGGLEVTLQAVPPKGQPLTSDDLSRSVQIMRNRVDKLGVAEPEIRKQGSNQIVIQLPGIKNPEAAAKIIGTTAQLELFDLQGNLLPPSIDASRNPVATSSLYNLLAGQQALVKGSSSDAWYLFNAKKKLVGGPTDTREALLKPNKGEVPKGFTVLAVPPKSVVVTCGPTDVVCPGVATSPPTSTSYYLFRYEPDHGIPEMTGADLKLSGTQQDFDPQTGQPIVLMQFTNKGQKKFETITRDLAQRGKLLTNTIGGGQDIFQNFAIVLDREIKSWPQIDWTQYPNGITGGNGAQITGLGSIGEAKNLAIVLQTGALPVKFETLDRTDISATLGRTRCPRRRRRRLGQRVLPSVAEMSVRSSVSNLTGSAPVWRTIARSFASPIDPSPVICAPFPPVIPFGYCVQSICGHDLISRSRTIAKFWKMSWPPPIVFVRSFPRCARSRVMSSNFFCPLFVNCMSTIGSPVFGSKSCCVPDNFRSAPVISGIPWSGSYRKR